MSDRLAVMREGEIEQVGPPQDVYDRPTTTYVADFLGLANLLPATVEATGRVRALGRFIETDTADTSGPCTVFVRPERIRLVEASTGVATGTVTDVIFVGSSTHVRLRIAGEELQAVLSNDGAAWVPAPGTDIGVEIPADSVRVLSR